MQSGVEVAESWISTAIGAVQHELVWFGQWRSVTKSRGGAEKFWPPDQLCTFFFLNIINAQKPPHGMEL
jgi:hypothetical protein